MDSLRPLAGRCALITGSVRGLGLVTARRLAASGCHIAMNGFGAADDVEVLRRSIEDDHHVRAVYSPADLRVPADIERLVRTATEAFGRVDILVNNAVVRHTGPLEEVAPADWDESVAVNISAPFHITRLVLPAMKQRGWGRIVNVSSIYGLRGAVNRVGYVTGKTALIGLTRAVALETVTDGITCNAICPGTTETPIHEAALQTLIADGGLSRPDAERTLLRGKQPTGRLISAEQVAALIVFLCSPDAADITGAVLPIDGGWSAG
jgi:3-hydroxybutyrate dehydrogenase